MFPHTMTGRLRRALRATALALCLAGTQVPAAAQQVYLDTRFSNNDYSDYVLTNVDEMPLQSQFFKNITLKSTWFPADGVNNHAGRVMASCSLRQYDLPTDNWLITPLLHIDVHNAFLAWEAQSVHRYRPEQYEVLVSEGGTEPEDFTLLLRVDGETYHWQRRVLSLASLAGKDVRLAFRHTTTSGYLLAIDNVYVGQLADVCLQTTDLTLHSAGLADTAPVEARVQNVGRDLQLQAITCEADGGQTFSWRPADVPADQTAWTLPAGAEVQPRFDVPVSLHTYSHYTLHAVEADGTRHALLADSLYTTRYPRTMLLDKATAYWCTSCPTVEPFIYHLQDRMGKQLIEVVTHYPANNGNDPGQLVCETFHTGIVTNNLPAMFFDRDMQNPDYSGRDYTKFEAAVQKPCNALVTLQQASTDGQLITGSLTAEFAEALDNSQDKYRVALAVYEKHVDAVVPQSNNATLTKYNEFYFLPATITAPLNNYVHVARGTESAFAGVPASLPASIEPAQPYTYQFTIPVPEGVSAVDNNLVLVAYVLNVFSKAPLNAAQLAVAGPGVPEGIGSVQASPAALPQCRMSAATCHVQFPQGQSGTVQVYAADGRKVLEAAQPAASHTLSLRHLPQGTYVVRMGSTAQVVVR